LRGLGGDPITVYINSRGGMTFYAEHIRALRKAPNQDGAICRLITPLPAFLSGLLLLLSVFSGVSCGHGADPGRRDTVLVPGVQCGLIRLGANVNNVTKIFGDPDWDEGTMGTGYTVWNLADGEICVTSRRVEEPKDVYTVRQITITSRRFSTVKGLRVGDPLADLFAAYPILKESAKAESARGDKPFIYNLAKEGIAFYVAPKKGKAGTPNVILAIAVYWPREGINRFGNYNSFPGPDELNNGNPRRVK